MKRRPETVDEYLASLSDVNRATLQRLRRLIHELVPDAEECISYQLPAFRLDGKVLVLFGASARHCALYPGSGTAVEAFRNELVGRETSKGAIRFTPDKPLPVSLLRKLLRYRIAENAAGTGHAAVPRRG